MTRIAAFTLSIAALTAAPAAYAGEEPSAQDIAQARQLGQQGQAAFDAGNYVESEKLWAAASKLYPIAPTLTLGLARAQEKVGHFVGAQESYNKIIREWGNKAGAPQAFKDAADAAKAEVAAVSARVATVVITVEGGANWSVSLDGQPMPAAAVGLKRPVDPGKHVVHVEAEGMKPADTTFTVAEAGAAEAKIRLEKADGPVATHPPAGGTAPDGVSPPREPPPSGSNKTLAIVAFGVGGAGLVFGAVTGLIAIGKHGDLADKCPGGTCSANDQSAVDSYKTMGTLSTVGFVVAGVGAAAGAVLLLTSPKASSTAYVSPYVGLGNAGVSGRF